MALRGQKYTLVQINALLDGWVNDAADTRWTSAEKDSAIQSAILAARGNWEGKELIAAIPMMMKLTGMIYLQPVIEC